MQQRARQLKMPACQGAAAELKARASWQTAAQSAHLPQADDPVSKPNAREQRPPGGGHLIARGSSLQHQLYCGGLVAGGINLTHMWFTC